MTHCLTPRWVKAPIILESWPTLSHTISSTSEARAGSVSPSNATATSRRTPDARACRANSRGNVRLPAISPSDSRAVFIIARRRLNRKKTGDASFGSGVRQVSGSGFQPILADDSLDSFYRTNVTAQLIAGQYHRTLGLA